MKYQLYRNLLAGYPESVIAAYDKLCAGLNVNDPMCQWAYYSVLCCEGKNCFAKDAL